MRFLFLLLFLHGGLAHAETIGGRVVAVASGLDKTTAIDLFPAVEAGLMSTLSDGE
jgi:hypothetical protein